MTIEEHIHDIKELHDKVGDDSTPLISLVREDPPSHWGSLTSQSRTLSPQYLAFLNRHKEVRDGNQ